MVKFRCKNGIYFVRDCQCDMLTNLALRNPDRFDECKSCKRKRLCKDGDYVCIADRVSDLDEGVCKEKVPQEITVKLPIQLAVDLSDYLMALEPAPYPFGRLNSVLFAALEEQFYKVVQPVTYKRIHEILEKGDGK